MLTSNEPFLESWVKPTKPFLLVLHIYPKIAVRLGLWKRQKKNFFYFYKCSMWTASSRKQVNTMFASIGYCVCISITQRYFLKVRGYADLILRFIVLPPKKGWEPLVWRRECQGAENNLIFAKNQFRLFSLNWIREKGTIIEYCFFFELIAKLISVFFSLLFRFLLSFECNAIYPDLPTSSYS